MVAVFICIAGWRLGRRTIDTLTDTAPAGAAGKITAIVARIPGVVAVERVRVRPAGDTLFVDLVVAVSRTLPLDRVAAIKAAGRATPSRREFRKAETTVNTEPRALDDETVLERVMVIARNRALAVHHVTVHAIGGRLSVSLDLEVDGSLSLGRAHEIADGLEAGGARRARPRGRGRDPYRAAADDRTLRPRRARTSGSRRCASALAALAGQDGFVRDVHDVRVRETADGEIVNFHAYVDPALTVSRRAREGRRARARAAAALPDHQARDRPRRAAAVSNRAGLAPKPAITRERVAALPADRRCARGRGNRAVP